MSWPRIIFVDFAISHGSKTLTSYVSYFSIAGPPSEPDIHYESSNRSICFDTYSHPNYPVLLYNISIIINRNTTQEMFFNFSSTSECISFPTESIPGQSLCGSIEVSVTAINTLGHSRESHSHEISGKIQCLHKHRVFTPAKY